MSIPAHQLLKELQTLTTRDLTTIDGIGSILAQNIVDFAHSKQIVHLAQKFENLEKKGIQILLEPSKIISSEGRKTVCITGGFAISREEIRELLEKKGYKIVNSISKKTDILLAGESAGSKLSKAETLQIPVYTDYQALI